MVFLMCFDVFLMVFYKVLVAIRPLKAFFALCPVIFPRLQSLSQLHGYLAIGGRGGGPLS